MDIEVLLVSVAISAAVLLVSAGGVYAINVIKDVKTNTNLKKMRIFDIGFETAEKTIEAATKAAVGKLEQVSAKELREKVKNGLADREALGALANEAFDEIMKTVSPDVIAVLKQGITDVESYVKNEIETQVGLLKSKSAETK